MKISFRAKPLDQHASYTNLYSEGNVKQFKFSSFRDDSASEIEMEIEAFAYYQIVFDDGQTWMGPTEELKEIFKDTSLEEEIEKINIPKDVILSNSRGGIGDFFSIDIFSLIEKPIKELSLAAAVDIIEGRLAPDEGVFHFDQYFSKSDFNPDNAEGLKYLLLLHGTASSCKASFENLNFHPRNGYSVENQDVGVWKRLMDQYDNRVIGFEHHTIGKDIFQNVIDLLKSLPDRIHLDILSQSRGGLIGELLVRFSKDATMPVKEEFDFTDKQRDRISTICKLIKSKNIKIDHFIRVACPAAGIALLSDRLSLFFNIFINLTLEVTGVKIIKEVGNAILILLDQKELVLKLPGLEAMKPTSNFQEFINYPHSIVDSPLHVIESVADYRGSLGKGIIYFLMKLFFLNKENDFVVDTASMTLGFNRKNGIKLLTILEEGIHHLSYFSDYDVQENILNVFSGEDSDFQEMTSEFEKSVKRSYSKEVSVTDEHYKGDVLLIPGIFASSIKSNDQEIWPCLNGNEVMDKALFLSKKNIETEIIDEYYIKLIDFLSELGYRVLKFSYDWRNATSEIIPKLGDFIQAFEPVRIESVISFYTGANIAFELWKREKEKWNFLNKNTRYLLLGSSFSTYEDFIQKEVQKSEVYQIFSRLFGNKIDVVKEVLDKLDSFKELKRENKNDHKVLEEFRKLSLKIYGNDFQEIYEVGNYLTDFSTGELTLEDSLFSGYRDLIRMGKTENPILNRKPSFVQYESGISNARSSYPIIGNNRRTLLTQLQKLRETKRLKKKYTNLKVTVTCGHLAKSLYPVMVGHTSEDNLRGAENAVNALLDYRLSDMIKLGVYPMKASETEYIPALLSTDNFKGGIVICYGNGYDITGYKLEKYVQKAALNYALKKDVQANNINGIGISTVLIGSLYGRLTTLTCVEHIIKGIYNANELLLRNLKDIKITNLEFIEIYEDRHIDILVKLRLLQSQLGESFPFTFDKSLVTKAGARIRLPNNYNQDWYNRYEITKPDKDNNTLKYASNTSNSAREIIVEKYDNSIVDFLSEESKKSNWDNTLSKTLFELLIPNELKLQFARQANIVLALDKETANFPWEMISAELSAGYPISIKAWMIRQLNIEKKVRTNYISKNTAFIVGNPDTQDQFLPLQYADEETENLNEQLQKNGFTTTYFNSKESDPIEIVKHFVAKEYKLIHFAAHGLIDKEDNSESKIVIGRDRYIDFNTLKKMSYTPEFAFINCCYLGIQSESVDEDQKHLDYPLFAASVGTQLVSEGYKAIIVAGWKLDDRAAKTFSSVFYKYFLEGASFAQSVLFARKACFNDHPSSNTWGAYQCYGNPDYKLMPYKGNKKIASEEFIVPDEFIILIRNFMNDVIANSFKDENHATRKLDELADQIQKSKFNNNAKILESLAKAYMEILAVKKSIDLFEKVFSLKDSNFNFRSLEHYYSLLIRKEMNALFDSKKPDFKKHANSIMAVIKKLDKLMANCPSSDYRFAILGSAWQRLTAISFTEYRNEKVQSFYKVSLGKADHSFKESHYALIMYFKANYLQKGKFDDSFLFNKEKGEDLLNSLENELYEISNSDNFWDEMALFSYYQLRLLISENKNDIEYYCNESIRNYKKAWAQYGGTFRHLQIEKEHCYYLIQGLEYQSRKPKSKIVKDLIPIKMKAFERIKNELSKL